MSASRAVWSLTARVFAGGGACPRCGSGDVRPSRRPFGFEWLGLQRWRCGVCGAGLVLAELQARSLRLRAYVRPQGSAPSAHVFDAPPRPVVDFTPLDLAVERLHREGRDGG